MDEQVTFLDPLFGLKTLDAIERTVPVGQVCGMVLIADFAKRLDAVALPEGQDQIVPAAVVFDADAQDALVEGCVHFFPPENQGRIRVRDRFGQGPGKLAPDHGRRFRVAGQDPYGLDSAHLDVKRFRIRRQGLEKAPEMEEAVLSLLLIQR